MYFLQKYNHWLLQGLVLVATAVMVEAAELLAMSSVAAAAAEVMVMVSLTAMME